MIGEVARVILDDCEDRAVIVVDENKKIIFSNRVALSLYGENNIEELSLGS